MPENFVLSLNSSIFSLKSEADASEFKENKEFYIFVLRQYLEQCKNYPKLPSRTLQL